MRMRYRSQKENLELPHPYRQDDWLRSAVISLMCKDTAKCLQGSEEIWHNLAINFVLVMMIIRFLIPLPNILAWVSEMGIFLTLLLLCTLKDATLNSGSTGLEV